MFKLIATVFALAFVSNAAAAETTMVSSDELCNATVSDITVAYEYREAGLALADTAFSMVLYNNLDTEVALESVDFVYAFYLAKSELEVIVELFNLYCE